jgi:hypothetical protein
MIPRKEPCKELAVLKPKPTRRRINAKKNLSADHTLVTINTAAKGMQDAVPNEICRIEQRHHAPLDGCCSGHRINLLWIELLRLKADRRTQVRSARCHGPPDMLLRHFQSASKPIVAAFGHRIRIILDEISDRSRTLVLRPAHGRTRHPWGWQVEECHGRLVVGRVSITDEASQDVANGLVAADRVVPRRRAWSRTGRRGPRAMPSSLPAGRCAPSSGRRASRLSSLTGPADDS